MTTRTDDRPRPVHWAIAAAAWLLLLAAEPLVTLLVP